MESKPVGRWSLIQSAVRRIAGQVHVPWRNARSNDMRSTVRGSADARRLSEVLAAVGDALLLYKQDGTVEYLSVAAQFGGGHGISWQSGFVNALHPEDHEHVAGLFQQAFDGHAVRQLMFRLLDQANNVVWVQASWGPRTLRRNTIGVWVLLREVTAQIRAQHELRQIQQMVWHDDRLRSLGRLSAEMAHELNNPLTAVQLRAEILLDGALPEDVRDEVSALLTDTRYATRLVHHMLGFARQREMRCELVDLNALVAQILTLRETPLKIQQIQVDVQLASGSALVRADSLQLQQVILNLLTNAQQALLDPKWLALSAHTPKIAIATRIQPDVLHGGELAVLRIQDNGPGIPHTIKHRIFEPFFTTKLESQGTGLGLSIVQDIVQAHGGWIEITSAEGQGTCIDVLVPLAVAPAAPLKRVMTDTIHNPYIDRELMLAHTCPDGVWKNS